MRKIVGYSLIMIGIGMMLMLLIPSDFVGVVISLILILVGYNLFCGCC